MYKALSSLGIQSNHYAEVKGNLPEACAVSLVYLSKLSRTGLSSALSEFRENIFPHTSRQQIPLKIASVLEANSVHSPIPIKSPLLNDYESLFSRLDHLKGVINEGLKMELTPAGISEAIKVVTEFCDRAQIGFLTGDIDIELHDVLINHLSHIELDSLANNTEIYEKLEEHFQKHSFAIPKNGIPNSLQENPQALFIREIMIEKDSAEIIMNKIQNDIEALTHKAFGLNYLTPKEQLLKLFLPLCKQIRVEQEKVLINKRSEDLIVIYMQLKCPADKLAIVTLNAILRLASPKIRDEIIELKFSTVVENIGNDIKKQILNDKRDELFTKFKKKREAEKKQPIKDERFIRKLLTNELKEIRDENDYKQEELCKLGADLLDMLITSAKTPTKAPIYHEIVNNQKSVGVIRLTKDFLRMLMGKVAEKPRDMNMLYLERTLPSICKPGKWTDWETGGYIQKGFSIMRFQGSKLQRTALERADLSQICESLNIIGDTPWRINQKVLNVVEDLYASGGGVGEIPVVDTGSSFVPKADSSYYKKQKVLKDKRDNWSLLSDFEIKLGIARAFSKVDRFFMPLNLDFRGRIYPISPHLNQIGNDTSRGLLEFARGKPLGKEGLRWLKIHLANKMGFDKLPLKEREQIAEDMIEKVHDIAYDPLKHREWLNSEDQWQSLATVFELSAALKSKDPEEYVSHLHIHQDGSCNGLQHYAALGRDVEGAEQVNLADRELPGDLYTAVSKRVQQMVDADANNGHRLAEKLVGQVKRKIVKQTVMTSVYGVTYEGAKEQIKRQLKDLSVLEDEDLVSGANYLARHTMSALTNFFEGAQRIKDWLIDCASLISKRGYPVSWITPLGLPVVQPYRRGHSTMFIDTVFQRVTLLSSKDHLPVSVPKQKSAFPPNYVHSLDSTHLMMTAVECHKQGIDFAAVHDSFWTHASDIGIMNKVLRDQFVALHSQPLLDNLLEGFRARFPKVPFKDVPVRGDFDLNRVLMSTYFFA